MKLPENTPRTFTGFAFFIAVHSLSLFTLQIVVRAQILGFGIHKLFTSPLVVAHSFLASLNDFYFLVTIAAIYLILGWAGKNLPRVMLFLRYSFLVLSIFILFSHVVYSVFINITGSAITYQWLFYSDFLNSPDAKNATVANLNVALFAMLAGLLLLLFGLAWLINLIASRLPRSRRLVYIVSITILLYMLAANWYAKYQNWGPPYLASPLFTFLSTSPLLQSAPNIFTMAIEWEEIERIKTQHESQKVLSKMEAQIKNVVLLILESIPAEYIQSYNGNYDVTPNLTHFSNISFQANNAYAHTPSTNKSLFSLLSSLYPWISFSSITSEHPNLPVPSLSSVLSAHHFHTAFITSADNRFQNIGSFLEHQSFDVIKDQQNIECDIKSFPSSNQDWLYMDGIADACIDKEFGNWLESIRFDENPFFAMLWTVQTHYPYFNVNSEKMAVLSPDPEQNRYLNALKESDQLFGDIMTKLKNHSLDSSTLVVVVGDHGESFGRHQQRGHATKIYEENIRVPLIFFNPALFRGNKTDRITGLIDVAPTILHTLGIQAPETWQGKSVLYDSLNTTTYFFAPYSTFIFGYRENNYKYIYDAGYNITELYDLENDPLETRNLIEKNSAFKSEIKRKLATWVQYHDSYMNTHAFP